MPEVSLLPLLTEADPAMRSEGSIDPLGLYAICRLAGRPDGDGGAGAPGASQVLDRHRGVPGRLRRIRG